MKKHTKFLATLLTIAIILSLVPYTALAAAGTAAKVFVTPKLVYDSVYSFYEGLAWFGESGKYGYIDTSGNVVIAAQYDKPGSFSDGLAAVGTGASPAIKYGYIDKNGKAAIPFKFDGADDFANGAAVVKTDGKYGIINKSGEFIVQPVYDEIYGWYLRFGFAIVQQDRKYGVIDLDGKVIVPVEYDGAYYSSADKITVSKDGLYGIVDTKGNMIVPVLYNDIGYNFDELIRVGVGTWGSMKCGYIDIAGNVVIPLEYDYAEEFYDGKALVGLGQRPDMKYGYIDTSGQVIVPIEYDDISWYMGDFQRVKKGDRVGLIDVDGAIALPEEYEDITFFSEDKAWVKKDGFWGIVEAVKSAASGLINILVPPTLVYDSVYPFSEGLARVGKGDSPDMKYGFADTTGGIVIPMEYDSADSFYNGQAIVSAGKYPDMKYGVIDKSGKTIIGLKYEYIYRFTDELFTVTLNGKRGVIDKDENIIVPILYDYIYSFTDDLLMAIQVGPGWSYKYGLLDRAGNVMLPVEYDAIYGDVPGYCRVQKDGKWGLLDLSATVPAPPPRKTARPTASTVIVNGEQKSFDAYNIDGSNFFKLRDLAYTLDGTNKNFEVVWDGENDAILVTSLHAYTVVGGEMTGKGEANKTATQTSSRVLLDGEEVSFTAYNIDGNNYFKLRDVGEALDFSVVWVGETNTIIIDTSLGYTPE